MENTEKFIKRYQEIVLEYETGRRLLPDAAEQIIAASAQLSFDKLAHPMTEKVLDIAFDIAEDYRSEDEDKASWVTLTKTFDDYLKGNWEPTCWIFSAIYGEYEKKRLHHSYSVAVRRKNGEALIETANSEIKDAIDKVIKKLNPEQTDERFLQNLAKIIPNEVGKHRVVSVDVDEYLITPYHSNA